MSASQNTDRLFWLAYCRIIQNEIGPLGESNATFFSTKNQRGPVVEPFQETYTNYGIYNIADQLLNSDNMFYTPSATNTYTGALMSYLSWVDVGGDNSDARMLQVMNAKKIYDQVKVRPDQELDVANTSYQKRLNMGVIPKGQTFSQWLQNNAPNYFDAVNETQAAAAQYRSAVLSLNGPLSPQWAQQMQRLNAATNSLDKGVQQGLTMEVTSSTPPSISDVFPGGTAPPAPTNTYCVPQYGCPQYRNIVVEWQKSATKEPKPTGVYELKLDEAENTKDSDFGHTKLGGDLSFTYRNIFSFGVNAATEHEEETLSTKVTATNVKITMSWDATAKAQLTPGAWNIANPHGDYPDLKKGAPDSVKILVRPAEILFVSKLSYKVEFSGDIKTEFDNKVRDVTSGGGYIRVFGIPIGIGAQGSTEKNKATHTGTWDGASGVFVATPTVDAGFATILAITGEKVQTF